MSSDNVQSNKKEVNLKITPLLDDWTQNYIYLDLC